MSPRSCPWLLPGMLLAGASVAGASAPYLPQVGPPPLRFRQPPSLEALSPIVLPPLVSSEPPVPSATGAGSDTDTEGPASAPEGGEPEAVVPAPEPATPPPGPPEPPASAVADPSLPTLRPATTGPMLPTQVLIPFFTGTTSGPGVPTVVSPVTFLPPEPNATARSQATFTVTPR